MHPQRGKGVHPKGLGGDLKAPGMGAALTKGPAALLFCFLHYVDCGGVAPSALGPTEKPTK